MVRYRQPRQTLTPDTREPGVKPKTETLTAVQSQEELHETLNETPSLTSPCQILPPCSQVVENWYAAIG